MLDNTKITLVVSFHGISSYAESFLLPEDSMKYIRKICSYYFKYYDENDSIHVKVRVRDFMSWRKFKKCEVLPVIKFLHNSICQNKRRKVDMNLYQITKILWRQYEV